MGVPLKLSPAILPLPGMGATDERIGYVIIDWRTPQLAGRAAGSILARRPDAAVLILDADHLGMSYGKAANTGERMLRGQGDIVVIANADVELLSNDEPILALFDADPDLAVVGPRQVNARGRVVHGGIISETGHDDAFELLLHHRYWMRPLADVREFCSEPAMRVPTVSGSVMYWRRSAFHAVGGLGTYPMYYEETIATYRARQQGWTVLYTGAVDWLHHHEAAPLRQTERVRLLRESRDLFVADCALEGIVLSDLPRDGKV